MFADPQSLKVQGVATNYPRTGSSLELGTFTIADGSRKLSLQKRSVQSGKRIRHSARHDFRAIVSDPLTPANSVVATCMAQLIIDRPVSGLSPSEIEDVVNALVTWATPANLTKLLGGEL